MEAMRSAATAMTQDEMDLAGQRADFDRKMQNLENFYLYADQIQVFVSKDDELQKMLHTFELTSDRSLDRQQRTLFEKETRPRLAEANIQIGTPRDIPDIFNLAYDEIIGISILGDLWRDPTVDEILIDRWDKIVVERFGNLQDTPYRFRSKLHAERVARQLSEVVSDRSVSPANPIPTAVLPSARVQFTYGQIVGGGLAITIRKFKELMDMPGILAKGSLNDEMRDFLSDAVKARASILISGGVGTGKTTMINALSGFIPNNERVVTIEDAFELQLANRHVVSLQSKPRSRLEDAVEITMEDLMITTLRMRPDRIVVGEIREPAAAATMIQAATTGHDGTMTTVHATSSSIALNSRVARFLARSSAGYSEDSALEEVSLAFDLVIQIRKTLGLRYISEIALVDPTLVTTRIKPIILFSGHLNEQKDAAVFARVAALPPSTLLDKMIDEGINYERWTTL
jgi:pilus assembly protein CpaF